MKWRPSTHHVSYWGCWFWENRNHQFCACLHADWLHQWAVKSISTDQPMHHQFSNFNHHWKQKTSTWCYYDKIPHPTKSCNYRKKTTRTNKKNLLISTWFHGKNWPYIVLSCVKWLLGLFLWAPINPEHDFSLNPLLVQMLNVFKQKVPLPYETDSLY